MVLLRTKRLILRDWKDSDVQPFARMNADPRVMEFLPAMLWPFESSQLLKRIREHIEVRGFGLFAAESVSDHSFIGYIGLSVPLFEAHFTPCVEIGWWLSIGGRVWLPRERVKSRATPSKTYASTNSFLLPSRLMFVRHGSWRNWE